MLDKSKLTGAELLPLSVFFVFFLMVSRQDFRDPGPSFAGEHVPFVRAGESKENKNGRARLYFKEKTSTEISEPSQSHPWSGGHRGRRRDLSRLRAAVSRAGTRGRPGKRPRPSPGPSSYHYAAAGDH